eukprot:s1_g803.t1
MPFDRLVKALDVWATANPGERVVVQAGEGDYRPVALECHGFLEPGKFSELQTSADLIVSHAGMGAILAAGALAKPLVIMPRQFALGEHRNDHQMATARQFENRPGIHVVWNEDALGDVLDKRGNLAAATELSPDASPMLLKAIDDFIRQASVR